MLNFIALNLIDFLVIDNATCGEIRTAPATRKELRFRARSCCR